MKCQHQVTERLPAHLRDVNVLAKLLPCSKDAVCAMLSPYLLQHGTSLPYRVLCCASHKKAYVRIGWREEAFNNE